MPKPIIENTKQRQRIEAMANVFTKTDRVLSGNAVNVTVEDQPFISAPSWTDGRTITFNKSLIGNVTKVEDIIRLSGLNYHELAHVLYTPRSGTKVVKEIQSLRLENAFNVLEDQRIETFLTSVYPSTIPYLVSTFMRFCIQTDSAWKTNFVLMHGRRYLPADVRSEFRKRFIRRDLIPAFEAIIDEYRKIVYPSDGDRGLELTIQFQQLLDEVGPVQDPHGHDSMQRPNINSGRPSGASEQREASGSVDDADKELEERDNEQDQESADESKDEPKEKDDENNKSSDGELEDSDEDDDGESSGEGNASGPGSNGSSSGDLKGEPSSSGEAGGNGANGEKVDGKSNSQFRDLLNNIANQFEQLDQVIEDVADKQRAIVNSNEGIGTALNSRNYREAHISPEDNSLVRRFTSILERLSSDSDPGWESHASSGRINMRRVMEGSNYDELWDRWEEGNNDATNIECVIAIDTSGSMTYLIDQASRALWVIKRALETLDANVTVITYGNESLIAYKRNDRASRSMYRRLSAMGTTNARPAVVEAASILEASNRHNKIFISITDGQWNTEYSSNHNKTSDQIIQEMNNVGITTAIAYVGYYGRVDTKNPYYTHNCKIATSVNTPVDLIGFANDIVSGTIEPRKVS